MITFDLTQDQQTLIIAICAFASTAIMAFFAQRRIRRRHTGYHGYAGRQR